MKVLLGFRGEEDARALDRTVERAVGAGDALTVAVLEDATAGSTPGSAADRVRERLDEAGLDAEIRRVEGIPGSRLVEIAESEPFDELVLGSGAQSPMGKIEVGTVAEFVLLNSHVTVTLVR